MHRSRKSLQAVPSSRADMDGTPTPIEPGSQAIEEQREALVWLRQNELVKIMESHDNLVRALLEFTFTSVLMIAV
jgi:hypothetical protein